MTWQDACAASRTGIAKRRAENGDVFFMHMKDGALIRDRGGIHDWIFSRAAVAKAQLLEDWEPTEPKEERV